MRDYGTLLANERFYDLDALRIEREHGHPPADRILQNREEVIGLCELIETHGIRSYLEIGIWTGHLVTALHRLFDFEKVAVCDQRWAGTFGFAVSVPPRTAGCWSDSESEEYLAWREALGHIDLVFIDGNHNYHAVARDIAINRRFPHRFLALHDIAGNRRTTTGVRKAWLELTDGHKLEIIRPHIELGLDHSTMGIGVWSATETPGMGRRESCHDSPNVV